MSFVLRQVKVRVLEGEGGDSGQLAVDKGLMGCGGGVERSVDKGLMQGPHLR